MHKLRELLYVGKKQTHLATEDDLRRDYPDSPLKPRAEFWGGRAYFDLRDDARGCTLIQAALDGTRDDVEFKNQVAFYAPRCSGVAAAGVTPPDSARSPTAPAAATYAVQVLAVKSAPQVDEALSRLKVMGFDARVVRDTSGLFKIRVGHYATRDEAQRAQRRLKTRFGGQPFVGECRKRIVAKFLSAAGGAAFGAAHALCSATIESRKFVNCRAAGKSFARTAAITACKSSRFLPVTRTCWS